MKFNEIKELIELINDSDLSYLEVNTDESYIKMDKSLSRDTAYDNKTSDKQKITEVQVLSEESSNKFSSKESNYESNLETAIDNDENFEYISSPMVGTFYKAISPESEPFVTVGKNVAKGDVICIVEAMKLMNEIVAEFDCEIVSVLADNASMVEYGEQMFKVRRK